MNEFEICADHFKGEGEYHKFLDAIKEKQREAGMNPVAVTSEGKVLFYLFPPNHPWLKNKPP